MSDYTAPSIEERLERVEEALGIGPGRDSCPHCFRPYEYYAAPNAWVPQCDCERHGENR